MRYQSESFSFSIPNIWRFRNKLLPLPTEKFHQTFVFHIRQDGQKMVDKSQLGEEMVDKAFTCHETGRYYQIKTQKK